MDSLDEGQSELESLKREIADQAAQLQADEQEFDKLLKSLGKRETYVIDLLIYFLREMLVRVYNPHIDLPISSVICVDDFGGQILVLKKEKDQIQAQHDEVSELLEAVSSLCFVSPLAVHSLFLIRVGHCLFTF